MSLNGLIALLVVALAAFCLIEFNWIQQADRRAADAELKAKSAKQVVVKVTESVKAADAANTAAVASATERKGRSESRKAAVAARIKETKSEGVHSDCVDPALVSLLNRERADFAGAGGFAERPAQESAAAAACVTVADLVEADRAAAAQYNDLADRHNRLIDEVKSHHCNSISIGSVDYSPSASTSSDFTCGQSDSNYSTPSE